MSLTPIFVYGSGGHAKVVAEVVEGQGLHRIVFFVDDSPARIGQLFYGYSVVSSATLLQALQLSQVRRGIIAIGNNRARLQVAHRLATEGVEFVTAFHPRAWVTDRATVGPGSVVAAGAVINPDAHVGEQAIINTRSSVDHDCVIGRGTHVAPGATLCGGVRVGEAVLIGAGATVIENVTIGDGVTVGAGATVVKDVRAGLVVVGTPARSR